MILILMESVSVETVSADHLSLGISAQESKTKMSLTPLGHCTTKAMPRRFRKEKVKASFIDRQLGRPSLYWSLFSYLCHHSERLALDFPLLPALPAGGY